MIVTLFPTLLYANNIQVPKGIVEDIYDIMDKNSSVQLSNRKGWQSPNMITNKDFSNCYLSYLLKEFNKCDESIPKFSVENYWINVNKTGNYNVAHMHGNSDYSFCWYIQVDNESGQIVFHDPNGFAKTNYVQSCGKDFIDHFRINQIESTLPQVGDFLLFPSSLVHHVESNDSALTRISISGNINFV